MSLTNDDYNEILNEYKEKQLAANHLLNEKRELIYRVLPAYKELEDKRISLCAERTRAMIRGNEEAVSSASEQIEDVLRDQKLMLTGAGYSINYLDYTYDCPVCKDTGFVDGVRCRCFKQALMDRLYEKSSIKDVLLTENFGTLRHDLQVGEAATQFEKAVSKARNFVDEFGEKYANLCFSGTVGTGKTFLSNCIFGEIMKQGYSCIYFSAPTLFSTIADYKFRKGDSSVNPLELLYTCDLLVVDDLGTEVTNSFVISELLALLNERNLARKSMIISTNLSLEDLCNRYSDRIFSRLFSNFEICSLSGQDIRLYLKQMQNRK